MPIPLDTPGDAADSVRIAIERFEGRLANLPRKLAASVPLEDSGPRCREALNFGRRGGGWGLTISGPRDPRDGQSVDRNLSNLSLSDTAKVLAALPRLCAEMQRVMAERDRLMAESMPKINAADDAIKALETAALLGGAA